MRLRALLVGTAASLAGLSVLADAPASASPDHVNTLRQVCEAHDGTWVPRPGWWRARCYGARANGADNGTRAASMICTMQLDGEFNSELTPSGTVAWVCW